MAEVLTELLLILGLILANGLFAAAEIAIVSVRRSRISQLIEEGNRRAESVAKLHGQAERFLATVQIGITVVSALAAAIGGAAIAEPLANALRQLPLPEAVHAAASKIALGIVVAAVSYLSIVVGELVPKSLALRFAEPLSLIIATPLLGLGKVAKPLVWLLTASSNVILKPFHDKTKFTETRLTAEEIKVVIGEAIESGSIEKRLAEIIERAVDFGELTVSDVKIPRPDIVAIDMKATPDDIKRVLLEEGHTRMPVVDGTLDKVVGYVTAKDVVSLVFQGELVVMQDIVRPPYFVPETMRAVDLLRALQRRREHMAIVVDEYGGTAGLVTTEDLVEEIVGEIFSEDTEVEEPVKREAEGIAVVDAALPIREFNREFDADVPAEAEYETVGGLLTHLAGYIPQQGQSFHGYGYQFTVLERDDRRVQTVRVRKLPELAPPQTH